MNEKGLFEVKIDSCLKHHNEKFLFVRQIQCHMGIRTFNQLHVLNILVPTCSAPQHPKPHPFIYRSDLILF